MELLDEFSPDIILLDMRIPDMEGVDVLKAIKERKPSVSVVVLTGWGSISNAVETMKLGAEHYLTKPVALPELDLTLDRIIEIRRLRLEKQYYQRRMSRVIAGVSHETTRLHHVIDLMAENADTTVLLLGESGTGKGLVAEEIHHRSSRRERPFLHINCSAMPEPLLESELFGHERGAFTGAHETKPGLIEVADGGTVFLDEVADLPLSIQPKLLRMIETHAFKRVGGTREMQVDVRVIAASNRDLAARVSAGVFREDLYYRLNVFPVEIPPLRERPDDIPAIARHFVSEYNRILGKSIDGFSEEALALMKRYVWPGNVRELKNVVERAMVLTKEPVMDADLLPAEIAIGRGDYTRPGLGENRRRDAPKTLEEVEREYILKVLESENNNRTRAAKVLGIARSTLLEKLKKYGTPTLFT